MAPEFTRIAGRGRTPPHDPNEGVPGWTDAGYPVPGLPRNKREKITSVPEIRRLIGYEINIYHMLTDQFPNSRSGKF